MTPFQLGAYCRYRRGGMAARLAYQLATDAARPAYPFLADLDPDTAVTGIVSGLDVGVRVEADPDGRLGDDDVTGWFTDRWEPGCVPNTASGINAGSARWYRPSNYDLDHAADDLRQEGVSRGMLPERLAQRIERAMTDDAERSYCGVVATVWLAGHQLAQASLWGIDITSRYDPAPYLIETAAEVVDEALTETPAGLAATIGVSRQRLRRLRRARLRHRVARLAANLRAVAAETPSHGGGRARRVWR